MSMLNRGLRSQLSKQEQEDLLKKLLHLQGKTLLIYPQGSHTSLLTALAETIHTNDQTLHKKLCERLDHDLKNYSLPRRLGYIYDDPQLLQDFRKYPQLVNFGKIILQLFSASSQRRLNVYYLSLSSDSTHNLSCRIINQGGFIQSISIARLDNKYYNIHERELSSKHQLSLDDVFKATPQIDSPLLLQTFTHSETLIPEQKRDLFGMQQTKSTGKPVDDLQQYDLMLKKVKSSMPFNYEQKHNHHQYDKNFNKNETMSLRQQAQLINQCGGGNPRHYQSFQHYQQQNMGAMTPQQMYYLYYNNPYYPQQQQNKNTQSFLNYSQQISVHSLSPSKPSNVYNKQIQSPTLSPLSPAYFPGSSNYNGNQNGVVTEEEKRFTGRLKFFDDAKNYGFIIMDADQSDIFVHYDDLQKAGITKEVIKTFKNQMYMQIRFSFKVMEYFGKYKKSRKAVQLIIIEDQLSLSTNPYPVPE